MAFSVSNLWYIVFKLDVHMIRSPYLGFFQAADDFFIPNPLNIQKTVELCYIEHSREIEIGSI